MVHRPGDHGWHSYFEPGTEVLQNTRGIRDQWTLATYERQMSGQAYVDLSRRRPPERFDLAYLQSCHRELFRDVYPWAGQLRYVNMRNPADPAGSFLGHEFIETAFHGLTDQLRREGELRSLADPRQWADRAGYYWATVNNIHPFREGNGRSTRLFMQQLARAAGHDLRWERVDRDLGHEAVNEASRAGRKGQFEPMRELLQYAATGNRDRSASPREHLDFLDKQLRQELTSQTVIRVGEGDAREARYLDLARQSVNRVLAALPSRYPSREEQPQSPRTAPRGTTRPAALRTHDRDRRDSRDARPRYRDRGYGGR